MLFYENHSLITELKLNGTTLGPSLNKDHHGDARLYVELVLWQVQFSQSWFPVFEVEAVPTSLCHLSFTTPHPPSGSGERPRARWLLRSKQHPERSILPTPNHTATFLVLPPPSDPLLPFPHRNPWAPALVSAAWVGKHSPSPKCIPCRSSAAALDSKKIVACKRLLIWLISLELHLNEQCTAAGGHLSNPALKGK